MKYGKIMAGGKLENILNRLTGARALVCVLAENLNTSITAEDALNGVADLLEMICRDFEADISCAEDYTGEEGPA